MKQCPRCKQTYSDPALNFCLEDGELLVAFSQEPPLGRYADETPPTILLDQSRVTNPTNWPQQQPAQPPARWQPQGMQGGQASPAFPRSRDQTLPTVALILGILSLLLVCCYGGIWLGIPAAIVGFLGMRNADSDPSQYTGRGMAIGGMVLGVISLLSSIAFVLFAIVAS